MSKFGHYKNNTKHKSNRRKKQQLKSFTRRRSREFSTAALSMLSNPTTPVTETINKDYSNKCSTDTLTRMESPESEQTDTH